MDCLVAYIKFIFSAIMAGVLVTCGLVYFTENVRGSVCIGLGVISAMLGIGAVFF